MDSKDVIRATMGLSDTVFQGYLSDLSDQELLVRPAEKCNHPAWQIGHLIASEVMLLDSVCQGKAASLPDGFAEAHSKEAAGSDDPTQFSTLQEYQALAKTVRDATLAALDELPDEKLDDPAPEHMQSFCPTVGHMFVLIGTHSMMHAGQLVPLRRKLEKPVMF